jgi:hypothetical protein
LAVFDPSALVCWAAHGGVGAHNCDANIHRQCSDG